MNKRQSIRELVLQKFCLVKTLFCAVQKVILQHAG